MLPLKPALRASHHANHRRMRYQTLGDGSYLAPRVVTLQRVKGNQAHAVGFVVTGASHGRARKLRVHGAERNCVRDERCKHVRALDKLVRRVSMQKQKPEVVWRHVDSVARLLPQLAYARLEKRLVVLFASTGKGPLVVHAIAYDDHLVVDDGNAHDRGTDMPLFHRHRTGVDCLNHFPSRGRASARPRVDDTRWDKSVAVRRKDGLRSVLGRDRPRRGGARSVQSGVPAEVPRAVLRTDAARV